jgi:hypothetical protein
MYTRDLMSLDSIHLSVSKLHILTVTYVQELLYDAASNWIPSQCHTANISVHCCANYDAIFYIGGSYITQ